MSKKSPGWAATIVLVLAGMLATALVSVAATLGIGNLVWGGSNANGPGTSATASAGASDSGGATTPGKGGDVAEDSWATTARVISPSTVSIQVRTQSGGAEGTGVIYSADGQILTNAHVVNGSKTVTVTLADGRAFDATLVGQDSSTDLALLRIKDAPEGLTAATFANSDDLHVGEDVMAMGTPLGLANTATTGIVSALNRPVVTAPEGARSPDDASFTSAIQTDASVNPGNSGGPLVNRAGEVIGINSSIASNATSQSSAGSIGLGFAIPSNTAKHIADQLAEDGTAEHPLLGVRASDGEAKRANARFRGALIASVEPGYGAADAGLREGDLVIKVDEVPIGSATALTAYIRSLEVGSTHQITYVRNGKEHTAAVSLRGQ